MVAYKTLRRFCTRSYNQPLLYSNPLFLFIFPIPNKGDDLLQEYSSEIIGEALNELGPENCFVMLSSKMFNEKELNKKEKWMEGQYDINEIERKTIRNWMDVEMIPQLHVPYSNKYLAESLEMKDDEPSLGKGQIFN